MVWATSSILCSVSEAVRFASRLLMDSRIFSTPPSSPLTDPLVLVMAADMLHWPEAPVHTALIAQRRVSHAQVHIPVLRLHVSTYVQAYAHSRHAHPQLTRARTIEQKTMSSDHTYIRECTELTHNYMSYKSVHKVLQCSTRGSISVSASWRVFRLGTWCLFCTTRKWRNYFN